MREKLVEIGAKVVRHATYVTFQLVEVAVPRELFVLILDRIRWFGARRPLMQRGRVCIKPAMNACWQEG
jgi:hypothetical protein